MSEKIKVLYNFLYENYERLELNGSSGSGVGIPENELYPRDYLKFAEKSLSEKSDLGLINCVSNLKRAMDCGIDIFFYVLNLNSIVKKRNLKIRSKLKLLEEIGVFGARSLDKLNRIRNKMEHEYVIPRINEIELYFELVEALIRMLEITETVILANSELEFVVIDKERKEEIGYFFIKYTTENNNPLIKVEWKIENKKKIDLVAQVKDEYETFIYYLRCFFLLNSFDSIGSRKCILEQINYTERKEENFTQKEIVLK